MMQPLIHVAAAVITDSSGRILIAKRPDDKHQGGLWEFPGGKVEPGEAVADALRRELNEELGINMLRSAPLMQIPHHYSDKSVLLDVFKVDAFTGEAFGREGQPVEWVTATALQQYAFPAANKPIVNACLLPPLLAITPFDLQASQHRSFAKSIRDKGAKGLVFRVSGLSDRQAVSADLKNSVTCLRNFCRSEGLFFTVNCSLSVAHELALDAVHLTAERLQGLSGREAFSGRWLSASCHNREEIKLAIEKGCDFVFLSPVQETDSHPDARPLGWSGFQAGVKEATIPVYALGGVAPADYMQAISCGGQGVAAINAWLEE